ncbi:hypothetical protein FOMPIDRAFT_58941 [Fomitopsis schrenkii]|uniref:Uncharacterized protein n=1 Tax=Fomitopsis schrenkii TaxID=2126942 RepID=S8DH45_FOMSC|nr:hypothetical protein FOMPIDRAFT_58941 [Fomitopsis schrenkii]
MDHLLSECEAPGQHQVWALAESLWRKKGNLTWPRPSLGVVHSCACASFKDEEGKPRAGIVRLYRILVTESAHLIWRLWNKRVIPNEETGRVTVASLEQIQRLWEGAINERLQTDCHMTSQSKYSKKAIRRALVRSTWRGTLQNKESLPHNWDRGEAEVLVGIELDRTIGEDTSEISWHNDGVSFGSGS